MKLAFFVEGYTEVLLIKELAMFYYGEKNLTYVLYRLRGGNKIPIKIIKDESHDALSGTPKFTLFIYDCGGFDNIRSMISHQRNTLYINDFNKIIGIRDVHPEDRTQIRKLIAQLPFRMAQKPIPTSFLLCVMETEAWFIADHQHFLKISDQLTTEFIKEKTGIDVKTIDVESIETPAKTLNEIYSHGGEAYVKSVPGSIKRTVESLDLYNLFCVLPASIPWLKALITEIENGN